jgi:hypothetical protein
MPNGVIHRRRLLYVAPESWIVVDDFRGSGEHQFDFHYHLAEDAAVSVFASQPLQMARIPGWISRGYGEKQACSVLRASFTGPVPAAAMTFLLPECDAAVRQLTVESGSGIACSYTHDGFEDIVALSTGDGELAIAEFRMRGEFFWLRLEGGELRQVMADRASGMSRGGRSIFRRPAPGLYFAEIPAGSDEKNLCVEFAEL